MFPRAPDSGPVVRQSIRRATLLLLFFLVGCATTRSISLPDFPDWESRKTVLTETDQWEFAGRIGVSAAEEGFNGKLWWRQDGTVFRARISGPLGIGTVFINGNRGELTVTDNHGKVTRLEDAETDLRKLYGWTIPVTSLRFWALGIPDPSSPADVTLIDPGQLSQVRQGGWQVDIREYREGGGQPMPRRLTAVNGDMKVRLVVDEWTFRQ